MPVFTLLTHIHIDWIPFCCIRDQLVCQNANALWKNKHGYRQQQLVNIKTWKGNKTPFPSLMPILFPQNYQESRWLSCVTIINSKNPTQSNSLLHIFMNSVANAGNQFNCKRIYLKMTHCWLGKSCVEAEIIECAFFLHLFALLQKKQEMWKVNSVWQCKYL